MDTTPDPLQQSVQSRMMQTLRLQQEFSKAKYGVVSGDSTPTKLQFNMSILYMVRHVHSIYMCPIENDEKLSIKMCLLHMYFIHSFSSFYSCFSNYVKTIRLQWTQLWFVYQNKSYYEKLFIEPLNSSKGKLYGL